MDDIVGRIAAGVLIAVSLTLIPLVWVFNNFDLAQRSYVNNVVDSYVGEVRSTGEITEENYNQFLRDLSKSGMMFDIEIIHKSKTLVPAEAGDKNGDYRTSYRSYNKDDIFEYMNLDAHTGTDDAYDYIMKDGDSITIKVTSITDTEGSKFLRMITSGGVNATKLTASSGGMIGNTKR